MKSLLYISLVVMFATVPLYAMPTIKMLNDATPAFSMEVLENGFAGYNSGTVLPTFCVERSESFSPGSSYYAVLNTAAVQGGVSGGNPDPLDQRSAYLYTRFIAGDSNFQDQQKLQRAIWYIEGETTTSNSYVTLADTAVSNGAWSGFGNVRIANLYSKHDGQTYSGFIQDQLLMIKVIPAPGALILAGIGTMMVGWVRKRFVMS